MAIAEGKCGQHSIVRSRVQEATCAQTNERPTP
eukprot:CAMPEP_0185397938 /NCGR_PEP_ID=MMETSP1364-20130426/87842_1 /TAXON_ID=38817 /ORGANISM="Gephyrocapsa oceanica, Strain RCC1303" /LENGTH=32 /DNA_ID= /DNA_START= /DNA_END= /DNA_ORIENTATION=